MPKQFFHNLNSIYKHNPTKSLLGDIIARIMEMFHLDKRSACQVVVTLVEKFLYAYFDKKIFKEMNDYSRQAWLRNLLFVSKKGLNMLLQAASQTFPNKTFTIDEQWKSVYTSKREAQKQARSSVKKKQMGLIFPKQTDAVPEKTHPFSPFEWSYPHNPTRYYDDPTEGIVSIPNDVPPRPNNTACWNFLRKQWSK